ncbi:ABC transporter permease, partial [Kineosporia sp. A_224]|uniref:ABC transporter permease n=1 Tax=Kineosporia sp. A_224 TaxID=1962180 RepID=UPI00350F2A87
MRAYLFSRLRLQRRSLVGTGLAVALAVAFVVVVLGATSTLKEFVGNGAAPRARAATVVAVPDPERDFVWPTAAQAAAVRALPDVAAVSAVRRTSLQLAWPDGVLPSLVESAPDDAGLAWYDIVDGRAPARAGEVLVDRRSAADLGVRVGTRLQVAPQKGARLPADLVVTGLFRADGPQPVGRTVLARERDVAAWAARAGADGEEPLIEEVDVLARPGADVAGLVAAVGKIAPTLRVEPAAAFVDAEVRQQTQDVDVLGRLVLGFTAVATLVAAIVIANTFTILLAQRARDLALLRCVGATRRQLRRATRVEATVLGLVASAVGALIGAVVLLGGTAVASGTVGVLAGLRPRLGTSDVVLPVLLGLVVTVGASVLPTRRATRVAPLAALRPDTAVQVRRTSRLRLLAGALLGAAGGAALAAGLALGGGGTGVLVS